MTLRIPAKVKTRVAITLFETVTTYNKPVYFSEQFVLHSVPVYNGGKSYIFIIIMNFHSWFYLFSIVLHHKSFLRSQ